MEPQNLHNRGFAFARNPIVFRENFSSSTPDPRGGSYIINIDGTDVYSGRFFPPLSLDVSEIADAFIGNYPEPILDYDDNSLEPIVCVENASEMYCRRMNIHAEYAGTVEECDLIVLPGGISTQNCKRLINTGTDIFTARFFNATNNFFLTTRTADWSIVMKETELYPLYFVLPEHIGDVIITDGVTGDNIYGAGLDPGVYALDIEAARRLAFDNNESIPNIIEVSTDSGFACRVVIERSDVTRNRYRLKFRNSLGVFEIIELVGDLSITPQYPEDSQFKRFDIYSGLFYTDRERVEHSKSISIQTGAKRPDEVRFLMDMLGSEEVYLLDFAPTPARVIPSVEEFSYRYRPEGPETFTIKLEMADSEVNIMQDILDGSEGTRPRIFSSEFTEQFN